MKLKSLALSVGFGVLACISVAAQSYTFKTINYPHDTFTQLLGINVSGEIAGYHNVNDNKGFTYELSTKKFTNENFPGSAATQVIGIDALGGTCGFYVDQAGVTHGFLDDNNAFKSVDFPKRPSTNCLAATDWPRLPATIVRLQTAADPLCLTFTTSTAVSLRQSGFRNR